MATPCAADPPIPHVRWKSSTPTATTAGTTTKTSQRQRIALTVVEIVGPAPLRLEMRPCPSQCASCSETVVWKRVTACHSYCEDNAWNLYYMPSELSARLLGVSILCPHSYRCGLLVALLLWVLRVRWHLRRYIDSGNIVSGAGCFGRKRDFIRVIHVHHRIGWSHLHNTS